MMTIYVEDDDADSVDSAYDDNASDYCDNDNDGGGDDDQHQLRVL